MKIYTFKEKSLYFYRKTCTSIEKLYTFNKECTHFLRKKVCTFEEDLINIQGRKYKC